MSPGAESHSNILCPVYRPQIFFLLLKLFAGGQVVKDIQDFNRNMDNDIQGFGSRWDSTNVKSLAEFEALDPENITAAESMAASNSYLTQNEPGESKILNFKFLTGLLTKSKGPPSKFLNSPF